jgi:aconitate hydratase
MKYAVDGVPLIVMAGELYGSGSSRDWAAKGTLLLGVRAVIARSFERIHRSNLIGMGILPLRLPTEMSPAHLKLGPGDMIEIDAAPEVIEPRSIVRIEIHRASGERASFDVTAAIETSLEVETLKAGGMLPMILHRETSAHKNQR